MRSKSPEVVRRAHANDNTPNEHHTGGHQPMPIAQTLTRTQQAGRETPDTQRRTPQARNKLPPMDDPPGGLTKPNGHVTMKCARHRVSLRWESKTYSPADAEH